MAHASNVERVSASPTGPRPTPPPIESKAPPIVSHGKWTIDLWRAGGIYRVFAILLILAFVSVLTYGAYKILRDFIPRSTATVSAAAETLKDPVNPSTVGSAQTIETSATQAASARPKHQSRADAIQTLEHCRQALGRVQFGALDGRSAKSLEKLADLAWKLTRVSSETKITETPELILFKQEYLVLRPEVRSALDAFSRLSALIEESAANYELLGTLHPELSEFHGELVEGRRLFEEYEKLTSNAPDKPTAAVFHGVMVRYTVPKIQKMITALLEKLQPKPLAIASNPTTPSDTPATTNAKLSAYERYQAGTKAQEADKLDEAATHYREAVAQDPTLEAAHIALGIILYNQGDKAGARRSFEAAAKAEPTFGRPHYYLGLVDRFEGKLESAVARVRQATKLSPSTFEFRLTLAKYLGAQKNYREAAEAYRDAVALEWDDWDANWGFAEMLWFDDQDDAALKAYQRCLALRSTHALAYSRIAKIRWAKKERAQAIKDISLAVALEPKNADLLQQRAAYSLSEQKFQGAEADYTLALQIDPNDAESLDGLARVEHEQGRNKEALEWTRKALAARPDYISTKLLHSVLLMRLKQYPEAEEFLLAAMKAHPNIPELPQNLASCYTQMNRPDSNLAVLRRASVDFPQNAAILRLLGSAHYERGAKDEALQLYARAVATDPRNRDARENYAAALQNARRFEEATEQFRELVKQDPENAQYRAWLESAQKKRSRR